MIYHQSTARFEYLHHSSITHFAQAYQMTAVSLLSCDINYKTCLGHLLVNPTAI